MRINKYLAQATGLSRRAADEAIAKGDVQINGKPAEVGHDVTYADVVTLNGQSVNVRIQTQTIMLNKPVGYVCSRDGQGSRTVYELIPKELHHLKPVGRLDKDSSGLLLLTNHGELAHQLTHPSFQKVKVYEVSLHKPLEPLHQQMINDHGIQLDDGVSQLQLMSLDDNKKRWQVTMHEGRNRQIRRTFEALGYRITELHRTNFGTYHLDSLAVGKYIVTQ